MSAPLSPGFLCESLGVLHIRKFYHKPDSGNNCVRELQLHDAETGFIQAISEASRRFFGPRKRHGIAVCRVKMILITGARF